METVKEIIEKINVTDALVIAFCGVGMILSITSNQTDIAMNLGVGMLGYIGGKGVK